MAEPVKPETRGRIVDENLSGKRRPSPGPRSREGAPVATSTDTSPQGSAQSMDASLAARSQPPAGPPPAPARPVAPSAPSGPPPGATLPPTTGSREVAGGQQRAFGPLDPDVRPAHETSGARPRAETSGSQPRVRAKSPTDPPAPADPEASTSAANRPKKTKRAGIPPMAGAIAGAAVIVLVILVSVVPKLAGRASVSFAAPVPEMASHWGGRIEDTRVEQYVGRVASSLARHAPAVSFVAVHVTRDPAAHAVALPGREIVISAGLLRRLSSEAQLGAVLAHLVAHMEAGDIDRTFKAAPGADVARARAAALTVHSAERERAIAERTDELVRAVGYESSAFPDAFANLGAKSGRVSAFVQQHPVPPDALQALRESAPGGRGADADYARFVLDPLGRSATPVPEASANPPLPPKPPPTPKLDLSRPSDSKRKDKPALPRKERATSEPPTVPL